MKIGACIITYNPNLTVLQKGVESLLPQVEKIIIIDNGSKIEPDIKCFCSQYEKVQLFCLEENKGIATATNIALQEFINQDFDFVLTSDQDSNYPENYISNFKKNKNVLNDDNIAVYTPVFFDENENDYADIIVESKVFMKKIKASEEYTDVFHAIASGMIINLKHLHEIGMMDENLFIDWVDLEFCWRVRYFKKRIICCRNMTIHHKLGDEAKDIGYRKVSLRSWIRNYYITRNSFYLAIHTNYLRKISKLVLFLKSFRYIIGYTVLCKEHFTNLRYTVRGMHDGIHAYLGKIKEK